MIVLKHISIAIILLLATGLRFYNLAGQSLWADEGNSVALARMSLREIAQRTAFDIHPPFYYWLLNGWLSLFGSSETALRSLSALLGVAIVFLVWRVGQRLFNSYVGAIAAFLAAISPLLVYYSQEARMYMLLSFLGCLTVWLALRLVAEPVKMWLVVAYVLTVTAGLYTHYAYPVMLVTVNVMALFYFGQDNRQLFRSVSLRYWLLWQVVPVVLYLPWLPTAWRQLTTWPAGDFPPSFPEMLQTTAATLLLGLSWPFQQQSGLGLLVMVIILIIPALFHFLDMASVARFRPWVMLLYLWFLLPVILTLYVFSPAFLKFLVIAIPPLALLLALTAQELYFAANQRWLGFFLAGLLLLEVSATSLISVYQYHTNPDFARDDYRGISTFIQSVATASDAIILNAEGQQDVFNYYYRGDSPVYPLPRQRPLDPTETVAELKRIVTATGDIYVVYWAEQQADPGGVIENWLNEELYKATDQWFGNVRLVSYATPERELPLNKIDVSFGPAIRLSGFGVNSRKVRPGEIVQVGLEWRTSAPLNEDYTVFLQLLDPANHLVGQRDALPQSRTAGWPVNTPVSDRHGIFVEPGTPPGKYRLVGGLYHSQTGQRLPVGDLVGTDFAELGTVEVTALDIPFPPEGLSIQQPFDARLHDLRLLGYDFYKVGQRYTPDAPLHVGDPVRLVLYWQASVESPAVTDRITIELVDMDGRNTGVAVLGPLAAGNHPPQQWRRGEIVRSQFDLFLNGIAPGRYRPVITVTSIEENEPAQVTGLPFSVQ
jgi:mannosyltransferase